MKVQTFCILSAVMVMSVINMKATASNAVAFSYCKDTDELVTYGTSKAETYDVAVLIDNPTFFGAKVSEISIPVIESEYIKGYTVWASTALGLNPDKSNAPDLFSDKAEIVNGHILYTLPEEIPIAEGGIYIGYSFKVESPASQADLLKEPLLLVRKTTPKALYMHSSRTYKVWDDYSATLGYTSPMTITISGDFHKEAAAISSIGIGYGAVDSLGSVKMTIENHGGSEIKTLAYTVTVGDTSETFETELSTPIAGLYSSTADFKAVTPSIAALGAYPMTVTIDKVNGEINLDPDNTIQTTMNIVSHLPENRPLMEEFTGTGCGYCVRGLAAMEQMKARYPDDFICVSYHGYNTRDPMYPKEGTPNITKAGFPSASMNRTVGCDPYFGTDGTEFGIDDVWCSMRDEFTPMDIMVTAEWGDESYSSIEVNCDLEWVMTPQEGEYRVEYILISDDLYDTTGKDSRWLQSNNYANGRYGYPMYMEAFTEGEYNRTNIVGYHFNDVVILTTGHYGVEGSVTTTEPNTPFSHRHTLDLTQALNIEDEIMIQNPSNLSVVAMVLRCDDGYGQVVNSGIFRMSTLAGIRGINVDEADVISTEYFDLQGRKVSTPAAGLYIKSETLSDGTIRTVKVSLR